METVQDWRLQITEYNPVGPRVLIASLAVHFCLGAWRLVGRRTLLMPRWEALQIFSGMAIPVLLIPHIITTRIASELFGVHEFYRYVLAVLWPVNAWWQSATLLVVWTHACVGLHHWLRLTAWWRRVAPVMLALAVLIPGAALAGFVVAGRRVARMVNHPPSFERLKAMTNWPDDASVEDLGELATKIPGIALGVIAALVVFTLVRSRLARRRSGIEIDYRFGPTVQAGTGQTLLEISRDNGVPHVSLCGGRGRCTTCRVMIEAGGASLAEPGPTEAASLASVGAPPGTRLACQIRPRGDLRVHRIFWRTGRAGLAEDGRWGEEGQRAILFLDVRDFTRLSAGRLPYDVVFLLNRFFDIVTPEIENHGGEVDKYMGDGLLAVFGGAGGPVGACRSALAAAARIDLALEKLNAGLEAEGHEPLRIGMGIHVGELVIAAIGSGASAARTIIGEVVNTASRLEALCKSLKAQLVISAAVAKTAGIESAPQKTLDVEVRGMSGPQTVIRFDRARDSFDVK